jgi:Tfp pilus assembly protein PilZ
MTSLQKKENIEKRINPRKLYSGHIFFATKIELYEGQLNNYSRYGLFIETKAPLSVGQTITIALPYLNSINPKFKGQIMWCNQKGFGVELFRKRNAMNLRVIK